MNASASIPCSSASSIGSAQSVAPNGRSLVTRTASLSVLDRVMGSGCIRVSANDQPAVRPAEKPLMT